MPPLLNPAPPWAPDRSDFVILWHGCTALEKNLIELHDVDSSAGRVNTDFGRGFYTTTLERQARQWAWDRFYDWKAKNPLATANQPVVLRFRVRRFGTMPRSSDLDDGLDQLKSPHFVLGDYDSEDYWSLVQHCRQSIPANPSLGIVEVINHHEWRRAPERRPRNVTTSTVRRSSARP